ncbi:alpha/beta fold hydrolase [Thalassobius sp. S69A]|uniref:alpha/beta fold hydrolase n=1 Tax=unclassified Thalassovita TaxID=2619711 RepID=UPI000C0F0CC8|nr:alpha/beta hydrolase [Paracoccaceae bacterium]
MKDTETTMPDMAVGMETRRIEVNGVSVTYHEAGQANTDTAPIVLIHGSSGSTLGHFGFVFPMLAVRHRVISVDLAMPVAEGEKLELEHIEAQVLAVMKETCGNTPVTLLGFSLGAVVAAFLAARNPKSVENLVLLAGWAKTDTMMTFFNRTWFALRNAGVPEINDYTIYAAFGAPFLADKTIEMMTAGAMPLDAFVDAQMELNARIDISDLVPQIKARTLVIAGTYDQMVAKHHCRALFGMIDDARYAEVGSGHAVVFERAAEVTRLVDRFNMNPNEYAAGDTIPAIKP